MQISMILRGWQAAQSFSHTFYCLAFTFPSTMRMPGGQRRHGRVVCAADTWSPYLHVTFTLLSVVTEQWSISEQTHFITYIALNETTVETNNLSYSLKCTNHKLLIHYTEGFLFLCGKKGEVILTYPSCHWVELGYRDHHGYIVNWKNNNILIS